MNKRQPHPPRKKPEVPLDKEAFQDELQDEKILISERKRFVSKDVQWKPQLSIDSQLWIILWMTVFFLLFYSFYLPNNASISRLNIWELLPDLLLDNFYHNPNSQEGSETLMYSGWKYFPQRLPLLGMIFVVLLSAWGYGIATLKLLRLEAQLTIHERLGVGLALGLGLISLITLFFGYAGYLHRGVMLVVLLIPAFAELTINRQGYLKWTLSSRKQLSSISQVRIPIVEFIVVLVMLVFVWTMLLGAVLPETDFDVREYHLQGPKEFFQNGQITMLKHNVYTSFPFLTEMLSLLSMVLMNDWFYGSLVGKGVLMSFAPITALIIYGLAKRVWTTEAGLYAALIYLTTPWVYRISIIAYTEGALCCYTIATLYACSRGIMVLLDSGKKPTTSDEESVTKSKVAHGQLFSWSLLTGLFAGCAVATKYPGLVTVTIPLGAALLLANIPACRRLFQMGATELGGEKFSSKSIVLTSLGLILGVLITFGPWVLKNVYETGNPVYPLMYGLFGGEDLTPELVAKWQRGHAPDHYHLSDLGTKMVDVTLKSDWQSPLVFGLLPLAFVIPTQRRKLAVLYTLYVLWYFGVWWVCTHRLDRFWVPLLPVACLVAGMGYSLMNGVARWHAMGLMTAAIVFNLGFVTTTLCGNNSYLYDLTKSRDLFAVKSIRNLEPLMKDQAGTVLAVGEAQVFDAQYPIIYNTVFDDSIFERWCTKAAPTSPDADWTMREPAEIRKIFSEQRLKYILVNWQEILRYRETYGYTKFVTPKRFVWLRQQGLIGDAIDLNRPIENNYRPLDSYRNDTSGIIQQEMPELLTTIRRRKLVKQVEYYPVLNPVDK